MKKYNKFIAGGMTAAMVAGAIVPVASANYTEGETVQTDDTKLTKGIDTINVIEDAKVTDTTKVETTEVETTEVVFENPFSDITESNTHFDGIAFAYQNGIVSGYSDGTFGANDDIKRVHAALMIARALGANAEGGYADAGFTDVPANYAWAVNFLFQEGIINGTSEDTFGSQNLTTRGQMAKILVNAFDLDSEVVTEYLDSVDAKATTFTDTKRNQFAKSIETLSRTGVTTGTGETTYSPTNQVTRGQFATFIQRAFELKADVAEYVEVKEAKEAEEAAFVAFEVEGIKALNAKEIEVKFTREVETTDVKRAIQLTNALKDVDVDNFTVTIAEDKKSAIITLADKSKLATGKGFSINIELDKLVADVETGTFYNESSVFSDEITPEISGIVVKGADLELTFTDFISGIGIIKIDGKTIANPAFTGESSKTIILKNAADLIGGNHEILLSAVEDISGNKSGVLTGTFTVIEDLSAPKVTEVVQHDNTTVKVTFDKGVSFLSTGGIKVVKNGFDLTSSVTKITDKEYLVTITDAGTLTLYGDNQDTTIVDVVAKGFKSIKTDEVGTEAKTTVTLTKDKVAPIADISKLKVVNKGTDVLPNEVFTIEYDEDITLLATDSDFVVTDSYGVRHTVTATSVFTDTDGNTKVLEISVASLQGTDGKLKVGTYYITVPENGIEDKYHNKVKNSQHAFTVKGEASTVNVGGTATGDTITITYGDVMNGEAVKKENYTIDGKVLPLDTIIYLSPDKKTVTIKLPKNFIKVTGGAVITINDNVKTTDNVGIANGSKVVYIATGLVDNTTPTIASAVKKTNNTIELVFDENIDDTTLVSNGADNDFVVKVNGVNYNFNVTTGDNADDNKLLLTTTDTFNFGSSVTIEVTSVEGDITITDTIGNKLGLGTVTAK